MRGFFMHPLNTRLALIGGRGKVSQETETRRGLTHWVFFDVRARSSGADIFVVVRGFSLVFAISYLFLSLVLSGVFSWVCSGHVFSGSSLVCPGVSW